MRAFLSRVLVCLLFTALFSFLTFNAYAGVSALYGSSLPAESRIVSDSNCGSYVGYECNNGPSISDSGGCGTPCNNAATSPWQKHRYSVCGTDPEVLGDYIALIPRVDNVCSTADKCGDANGANIGPYLNAGACDCSVGGRYKTCCNSNGTTDGNCNTQSIDTTNPPYEGSCPSSSTTVMCGVSAATCANVDISCTTASCGGEACLAIFPQATPTPIPTPTPTPDPCLNSPTGLNRTCSANGANLSFSWNSTGASCKYAIRIDENPVSWGGNTVLAGDTVDNNVLQPSYSRSSTPGQTYAWWLHSVSPTSGNYSPSANGINIICPVPPTLPPGVTPTPTSTAY